MTTSPNAVDLCGFPGHSMKARDKRLARQPKIVFEALALLALVSGCPAGKPQTASTNGTGSLPGQRDCSSGGCLTICGSDKACTSEPGTYCSAGRGECLMPPRGCGPDAGCTCSCLGHCVHGKLDAGPTCDPPCASGLDCTPHGCARGCYSDMDCSGVKCGVDTECGQPPDCVLHPECGCAAVCYSHCKSSTW
jgi:hypothetical protein